MNRYVVACALIGIVAAAGCNNGAGFASVDADSNGTISMDEAASGMQMDEARFIAADTNADGSLDSSEYEVASAR
ncbi:MAG: hypothetical protein MnENMB40S_02780 [Rhizobiaceae bacterium MnEN-MB40S]|nr:MAG: hypothetical protein MnENMB40S_02780 [Rhizobiaceae bacterium MnEN-MB40S]